MMRTMTMPGFTANAALEPTQGRYGGKAVISATHAGFLSPALIAPPMSCGLSPCMVVGRCKTRVRCCRGDFNGACRCSAVPCSFPGPPDF